MLDYLLPEEELVPWILGLGGWLRLSRIAGMAQVPMSVARRQVARIGLTTHVWDDANLSRRVSA